MTLHVVPLTLREANEAIARWHRHHKPVQGQRFSLGVIDDDGLLHGVCVVGRPVARMAGHPRDVAEVTRLATDGTPNACSMLYAAAANACKAMGFVRIQTYILDSEPGTSLRAAGWVYELTSGGGSWSREDRPREDKAPLDKKQRWGRTWNRDRTNTVTFGDGQLELVSA